MSKESAYHVRKFAGKMMNLELQEVCNLSAFETPDKTKLLQNGFLRVRGWVAYD